MSLNSRNYLTVTSLQQHVSCDLIFHLLPPLSPGIQPSLEEGLPSLWRNLH